MNTRERQERERPRRLKRAGLAVVCAAVVATVGGGCMEDYNAPPEAILRAPETGTFFVGDPLILDFSEPINPDTLVLNIWAGERDLEGALVASEPLLTNCTSGEALCPGPAVPAEEADEPSNNTTFDAENNAQPGADLQGGLTVTVAEDGMSAELVLDARTLGKADVPFVLEVQTGLEDTDGNPTGRGIFLNYIFKPSLDQASDGPVPFDSGIYLLNADVEQPLPIPLLIVVDLRVLEDSRLIFAGVDANPISGAPPNTRDPSEIIINTTSEGFAILGDGAVRLIDDERFFETNPFYFTITIGPIKGELFDTRLTGKVVKNPDTGLDRVEGLISVSGITLTINDTVTEYDPLTAPFVADLIPAELIPEGGPDVCGDPICGSITVACDPPESYDTAPFCEEGGGEGGGGEGGGGEGGGGE